MIWASQSTRDRWSGDLSVAQQQMVEVAKALSLNARVLIMDEPTSALTEQEIKELFSAIRRLKARGVAIVYISHRMEELFAIGDRVTVLRDGRHVGTRRIAETTMAELVRMMVGRDLKEHFPKQTARHRRRSIARGRADASRACCTTSASRCGAAKWWDSPA